MYNNISLYKIYDIEYIVLYSPQYSLILFIICYTTLCNKI